VYTPRCGASSAQGVVGGTFKRNLALVSEQEPAEHEREKYVVGKFRGNLPTGYEITPGDVLY